MDEITPPPITPETPTAAAVSSDDKLWGALCQASILVGVGVLFPLIVYLVKKTDSPVIAAQAREALNFHISVYIYGIICGILTVVLIGFLLLPILGIAAFVLAIIATIKAAEGQIYHYPMTIRLVK